jgi:GAF domain-containing protein
MTDRDLRAAVAAGILPAEQQFAVLLQSIADVGRAIFGARAASILLLDEAADELVFAAVSGEGQESLIGRRLPSGTGVAGWVLVTRQPLVIEDVGEDERFSLDAAESTGYVPRGLMAVPLLHEERVLGVLEILDRPQRARFSLGEMDLLSLFAGQAAIALALLQRVREARAALEGRGELEPVAALAAALEGLEGPKREAAGRLLEALRELLAQAPGL